ncbi:minichromosome maintenance protein mcm7p [Vararia minispora EC-137]|uniref:Minichromosome maintenance protein mcm7p n=1 Tax=Vararia minispora EC-137 TaxID=1314806 RepID=A0ACB8QKL6_9AGAM|nr:minichromosome maintenance protein mcm7p [Vararia minispora EC-137]
MSLAVIDIGANYAEEKQKIRNFLENFIGTSDGFEDGIANLDLGDEEEDGPTARLKGLKYMGQLQKIANREEQRLVIELEDIAKHEKTVVELVSRIRANTRRYVNLFNEVVDEIMPNPTKDISEHDEVIDVIMHQRTERNSQLEESQQDAGFPAHLLRRYNLYFQPLLSDTAMAVRDVKSTHLGKLITVRGIVTRVSEVKPLLLVNAYTCDVCGSETFQEISKKQFTPIVDCQNEDECKKNGVHGSLHMQTRACRFSPFQEVKIQEMADQVPVGHIPRSMTVHVSGNLTRLMNPGDVVHLGGIFLPVPYTGFQAVRAGLLTDTYLEVHHIYQLKKQYNELELTPEIEVAVDELRSDPNLYHKLALSIAPEIYGHVDVKKALLLLLVGGVTKMMGDGMMIRGDLNVCLMGDPGVAKSQLLKYISKVAPRGVYTTGKGSSGVGLTAAVMRDPVTDEMVLEGGALVLADNGICCIDEFDKMEDADRTAIHEVMEQQTISISKAGISTTLNARTSILAAANPLYGRYNTKVSPVENINLPAALLSRFDLLFLILDKPSRADDERLAQHVTYVHMHNEHPPLDEEPVDPVLMRRPVVPHAVSSYVVDAYVHLRKLSKTEEAADKSHSYTSARTLLGVLRLSQALARLRWADEVEQADVDEALRLMRVSKESLYDEDDEDDARDADRSDISKIYRIIKDMAHGGGRRAKRQRRFGRGPAGERDMDVDDDDDEGVLSIVDVRARVLGSGFTESQLIKTLTEYEQMNVWSRFAHGSKLRFVE